MPAGGSVFVFLCSYGSRIIFGGDRNRFVNAHRTDRVKDFQRRAAFSPSSVYQHSSRGWDYIPVHDFADESNAPTPFVDCWCFLGSDAALLECVVCDKSTWEPGLYARVDIESPCWPKLYAVLREPMTRAVVESAMEKFVDLGFPERLLPKLHPGAALVRLGE